MKISYYLYNVTQVHQSEIKTTVQKNIDGKIHSYLKSFSSDAEHILSVKIERNKKSKYIGSIMMSIDGVNYIYKTNSDGFRIVDDLINHAFDRFKEKLSHK